jgi:hypothetical protein
VVVVVVVVVVARYSLMGVLAEENTSLMCDGVRGDGSNEAPPVDCCSA